MDQDKKKADLFNEIRASQEKIKNEDLQGAVERLKTILDVLKVTLGDHDILFIIIIL